jgi:cold-inducible RNA-binding protein
MKNLFVGNMNFQTTESDLRALFEPFGQVTRIHIVNDRETGQPRGFAFVEMAKDEDAVKAMSELNGKEVAGRALRVNEATPRPERGGSRGGFAPRGSGGRGSGGSRGRGGFSADDYRDSARQPREPRW